MAAINFDSQAVKKQAKLLEEAADQIQNQTIKVINAANEAVAASWSGKAGGIFVKFMQEENKGDKIRRVLQLYAKLSDGYVINKAEEAAYYGVTERSITRDIDDIRNFSVCNKYFPAESCNHSCCF